MNWTVPTIAGIQRMAMLLTVAAALALWMLGTPSMALSCLVGGALMIANLALLTLVGKVVLSLAQGGGAARIAVVFAPLKLLVLMGVVYLVVTRTHIDIGGFVIGSLTQLVAVFIETGRVSMRGASRSLTGGFKQA